MVLSIRARQARQPLRQRAHKKMTLSATDEFWHSPVLELEDSNSITSNDSNSTTSSNDDAAMTPASPSNDQEDFFEVISLPPAHHQLLFDHQKFYEPLKGYDHAQDIVNDDDVDDSPYGSGDDDDHDNNSSNDHHRQKLSAVKQQGGGSWLLGFARLNDAQREESDDRIAPGMVRIPSGASLESDECSTSESESDDDSLPSDDDAPTTTKKRQRGGGVSFSSTVAVQPIPHSYTLTPMQRRKMYTTCVEVRQNKIRNKKEYRYDNYNWRNATEEWEMGVDMVTGELIHPVHDHC
mmetsp:Transcript_23794/g.49795  ORF Transcript_23794/g.49795 Transcript_23794/m.49795 type:complete len:294 (+) Transcript_23794:192-1073(+)